MWLKARWFFTYRIKLPILTRVLVFLYGDEHAMSYIGKRYRLQDDVRAFLAVYQALSPQVRMSIDETLRIMEDEYLGGDEVEILPWDEVKDHVFREGDDAYLATKDRSG